MRSALSRLRGELASLRAAIVVTVALVALVLVRESDSLDLALGLVAALVVGMLLAASDLFTVAARPHITAIHLPARSEGPTWPVQRAARLLLTAELIVIPVLLATGYVLLALLFTLLAAVLEMTLLAMVSQQVRRARQHRQGVAKALTAYAPDLLVYTARANDASYQLAMWLPELERLGCRYAVVLRHPNVLPATAALTQAPVVCCPTVADLDAVVVPSARVAVYVNGVAQNVNLVGYRQLQHVYLGHGDSDKELSVHPAHAMFDEVFVAGQAAIDRYAGAGVEIPADKFRIIGRPQLAGVGRATAAIGSLSQPRVLVAPTWRGYNQKTSLSSLRCSPELVRRLIGRGVVVQFRPHPFSWHSVADRQLLERVDTMLARDRDATGRPHRLATETRSVTITDCFDTCDALVSDVGSVLVDFFVTGKPYAVVLPADIDPERARAQFPSVAAAYLLPIAVVLTGDDKLDGVLDDLLRADPRATDRAEIARYYIGGTDVDQLGTALRKVAARTRPAPVAGLAPRVADPT